jgi:hypothetical protein
MTISRQLIRWRLASSSGGQPRMNICSCGGRLGMRSYRLAMAACSGVRRAAPSGPWPPDTSGPAANAAAMAACMAATASGYRFGHGALYSPATSGFS